MRATYAGLPQSSDSQRPRRASAASATARPPTDRQIAATTAAVPAPSDGAGTAEGTRRGVRCALRMRWPNASDAPRNVSCTMSQDAGIALISRHEAETAASDGAEKLVNLEVFARGRAASASGRAH